MIRYVEPAQRIAQHELIQQFYRLRKKVFCDQLRWVEEAAPGLEFDHFDEMFNIYILYTDPESHTVSGGVRLMPTTGPTLMHSVWSDMLPDPDDFRSPTIWEATRFCVDDATNGSRKGNFVNRATMAISAAIMEFGAANGITHIIGVCESKFFEMAGAFGEGPEIISTRRDGNGQEIGCGLWSTQTDMPDQSWIRLLLGDTRPVLVKAEA